MTYPMFGRHFQVAYVVADVEDAMSYFRQKSAIAKWHLIDVDGPGLPAVAIATAYIGELMIELIQPSAVPSIYHDWLVPGGSGIRFHHLGFLVNDEAGWAAAQALVNEQGFDDAFSGSSGDMIDFLYVDTVAALGHYCEYIHLRPAGRHIFAAVPHN